MTFGLFRLLARRRDGCFTAHQAVALANPGALRFANPKYARVFSDHQAPACQAALDAGRAAIAKAAKPT